MMRNLKNKLHLAIFALICALLISNVSFSRNGNEQEMNLTTDSLTVNEIEKVNPIDSIKSELITEVENYVFGNYPKTNKQIPVLIVENGLENEIDIMFMMAQTQIETSFGTAGAGRESSRRSLFGVAVKKYQTYESAIEDYVRILFKFYLTRGRTEQHLMKKYTTSGGARYAGNPNYEVELRNAYSNIKSNTKISKLQEEYKEISKSYDIENVKRL